MFHNFFNENRKESVANVFFKIVFLKFFANFTGKHLCCNLLLNLQLYYKETLTQVFSCEIWEILRTPFFTEHLRWLLLENFESIFESAPWRWYKRDSSLLDWERYFQARRKRNTAYLKPPDWFRDLIFPL